jgi:sterol desaturase/sphingolipid hydroxylase (fatty acid hydroxylase superfamily)
MANLILAVAIIVLAAAERLPRIRFEPLRFFRPYFGTDLLYFLTGVLALGLAVQVLAARSNFAGLGSLDLPFPALAIAALVLYDLGGYVSHFLLHRIDALWELHKVHHSSFALDWLATFRAHILEHVLRHVLSTGGLLLLGFPATAIALAAASYGSWAAFAHSNLKLDLRWLEPVLITPRLHRLHHVPATADGNLGTIFSWWDRMRRSLVTEESAAAEPIGVRGERETFPQRWLPQLVHPLRAMTRLSPGAWTG